MAKTALASHVLDEGEVVCVERWVAMTKESPPPSVRYGLVGLSRVTGSGDSQVRVGLHHSHPAPTRHTRHIGHTCDQRQLLMMWQPTITTTPSKHNATAREMLEGHRSGHIRYAHEIFSYFFVFNPRLCNHHDKEGQPPRFDTNGVGSTPPLLIDWF